MYRIIIATNNNHKTGEIKSLMDDLKHIEIFSLSDFGIKADITEDGNTLEENALIKAAYVYKLTGISALSDDTGLFVKELNDEPGVYSARYAGEDATYHDNCNKLLERLKDIPGKSRVARFESVICFYIKEDEYYFFKGVCPGVIALREKGKNGFGYDPLFIPDGMEKTFAEFSNNEKNIISHRALALKSFREYIESAS